MIEDRIRNCSICQDADKSAKFVQTPIEAVPLPEMPFEKVAIDIKGPMEENPIDCRYAIVLVDYKSKWPEVKFCRNVTSSTVIGFLEDVFSREGLPKMLVSDNGSQFISMEFEKYLQHHGIQHIKTSLYYPQSNGLVERFNRTLKNFMQTTRLSGRPVKESLPQFLLTYRTTPHASGEAPAWILHGRLPRTKATPPTKDDVKHRRRVRFSFDDVPFQEGEHVKLRHPRLRRILRGLRVEKVIGPKTVRLTNGQRWHIRFLAPDSSLKEGEEALAFDDNRDHPNHPSSTLLSPPRRPKNRHDDRRIVTPRPTSKRKKILRRDPDFEYY